MHTREGGQSTVELALCLPVLVLLIACALDVVQVATLQAKLWQAAREGARVAAVDPDVRAVRAAVAASAPQDAQVVVAPKPAFRVQGGPITVVVRSRATARVPFLRPLFEGITLRARATYRVETP